MIYVIIHMIDPLGHPWHLIVHICSSHLVRIHRIRTGGMKMPRVFEVFQGVDESQRLHGTATKTPYIEVVDFRVNVGIDLRAPSIVWQSSCKHIQYIYIYNHPRVDRIRN